MPEEFAAAYQAAYEQALADFEIAPQRHDEHDGDPSIVDGDRERHVDAESAHPTGFERVRDTHWFVPFLLALLVLLLVLGAYGIGKAFAAQVGTESPGEQPSVLIGTTNQLSPGSA